MMATNAEFEVAEVGVLNLILLMLIHWRLGRLDFLYRKESKMQMHKSGYSYWCQ